MIVRQQNTVLQNNVPFFVSMIALPFFGCIEHFWSQHVHICRLFQVVCMRIDTFVLYLLLCYVLSVRTRVLLAPDISNGVMSSPAEPPPPPDELSTFGHDSHHDHMHAVAESEKKLEDDHDGDEGSLLPNENVNEESDLDENPPISSENAASHQSNGDVPLATESLRTQRDEI